MGIETIVNSWITFMLLVAIFIALILILNKRKK